MPNGAAAELHEPVQDETGRRMRGTGPRILARNHQQSEALANWMYDSLGLYTPAAVHTAPVGTYRMVYPVNPSYSNPRDARVYGAQGAGVPIVVPLAPTVRSGYNYSGGLPASRLTPISVPR